MGDLCSCDGKKVMVSSRIKMEKDKKDMVITSKK